MVWQEDQLLKEHMVEMKRGFEKQVSFLQAEVEKMREQVNKNSHNSSKPPSSDGEKKGGQKGHHGHGRKLKAAEEVSKIDKSLPTVCADCGALLMGEDSQPERHQVSELPKIKPVWFKPMIGDIMKDRNLELDFLRCIAILLVIGHHDGNMPSILSFWQIGGWIGVDLFFVLSGFLVSGLLFDEYKKTQKVDGIRFLIRRGMKIYPSFYALIILSCIFPLAGFYPSFSQIFKEIFYVQNYFPGIWEHAWSLAVEEHFYILLVITVSILIKNGKPDALHRIPKLTLIIGIACLLFRIITYIVHPDFSSEINYWPTHLRLDALAFGVWISYQKHFNPIWFIDYVKKNRIILFIFGIILIIPAFLLELWFNPFMYTIGFSLNYFGSGLILLTLTAIKLKPNWINRTIGYIGKHSYPDSTSPIFEKHKH